MTCIHPCDPGCELGPVHCEWAHLPNHKPGWHSAGDCPVRGGVVHGFTPGSDLVPALLSPADYAPSPERLRQLGLNVDADRLEGRQPRSTAP